MTTIRTVDTTDRPWVDQLLKERWGGSEIVSRGQWTDALECSGLVALSGEERVGLLTYRLHAGELELITLDSLAENMGVGGALLEAAIDAARDLGCRRVWLATTNDNLRALGFYQRRGFRIVAVRRDALTVARQRKPSIPATGLGGIPLQDEIELALELDQ